MGMYVFCVNGQMRVVPAQVTDAILNGLEFDLNVDNVMLGVEGGQLHISWSDEVSASQVDEAIAVLENFAKRYAVEPSIIQTWVDGEEDRVYVGPEGFDNSLAHIISIDNQIAGLIMERDEVAAGASSLHNPPFRLYLADPVIRERQRAAVLAALAQYRTSPEHSDGIASGNGKFKPLDPEEVDVLIESVANGMYL